ncbi:peptidylprolyl isomerase [Nocardioides panacisoli]|uniref:Peptidyl-prolyl cis-trans isomerase n=1 Tax=Nocardioides panacisoli TaxID=627624 RepID=A0ABP7IQE3_9ACTN
MLTRSFARPLLAAPVLVLALGLAACGSDDSGSASDDAGSSTPPSSASSSSSAPASTDAAGACTYTPDGTQAQVTPPPADPSVTGDVKVTMDTSVGEFHATLDAGKTPCTVSSFVSLADQGYFDGTTCHRMTTSGIYVLQCGDPTGTGTGGPGYSFADELSGKETYGPGTLAMANAGPNTNGSQFFIVYGDSPLPPQYTVFGTVDDATVSLIEDVAKDGTTPPQDGAPNTPVDIKTVTTD